MWCGDDIYGQGGVHRWRVQTGERAHTGRREHVGKGGIWARMDAWMGERGVVMVYMGKGCTRVESTHGLEGGE
jgi:hypothetical protein